MSKYRSAILVRPFLEIPANYGGLVVYGVFDRLDLVFDDMERPGAGVYAHEVDICRN